MRQRSSPPDLRHVLAAGGGTLSDTVHIGLASVTVVLMLLAMTFGAAGLGKRFRAYSALSMVVLVMSGALTFWNAPLVALARFCRSRRAVSDARLPLRRRAEGG
jgi:lysylphosphatidylglycerol synthetase-like protein (DUF2156 family)